MATDPITHGEVQQFIADTMGDACRMSDSQIRTFHTNCLIAMWGDLRDWRWFHNSWTVELNAGQNYVELPADFDRLERLWNPETCTDLVEVRPVCSKVEPDEGCACWGKDEQEECCCDCGCCKDDCEDGTNKWSKWDRPKTESVKPVTKPTGYWLEGGRGGYRLMFAPAPSEHCKLRLDGWRKPNCTFWSDTVSGDGSKHREWLPVDLPPEFHSIYSKHVLSMTYAALQDAGLSNFWLSMASSEMLTLTNRRDSPKVSTPKIAQFGGSDDRGERCGCANDAVGVTDCGEVVWR